VSEADDVEAGFVAKDIASPSLLGINSVLEFLRLFRCFSQMHTAYSLQDDAHGSVLP
jgi:hypothetical protein